MITKRLPAPVAIQDSTNHVVSVDLGAFVKHLLLFETYILRSIWLEDVRLLAKIVGSDGLGQLFQAGALGIYCESYTIGQIGQARADLSFSGNNQRLPLGSYSFGVIRTADQDRKIELALNQLDSTLQDRARQKLVTMPAGFSAKVFDGLYRDLRRNPDVVKAAARIELRKEGVKPGSLQLKIEEIAAEDFRVESNLTTDYGLSPRMTHRVWETALMAVAGLNQRFAEMMVHAALSGIRQADLPLLEGKLRAVIADLLESSDNERRFDRVISIVGLPQVEVGKARIDVEKLLKVRESDECRAFRDWLSGTDSLSDKDLKDRLRGLNSRIRQAVNSGPGRAIRFVVSNGLGFVPVVGPALGIAAGAIDSFLVERLAPRDAAISFLSESYPSVFQRRR